MRRWVIGLAIFSTAACAAPTPASPDAGESADVGRDAGPDADDDAAPMSDAGRTLVDPSRPSGYRTLHPACEAWAYDLDDSSTFDTTAELAVAIADARCRHAVACHEATSRACDPFTIDTPAETLHTPVDVVLARQCLDALGTAGCLDPDRRAAEAACAGLTRFGAPDGSPCDADRWCRSGHCEGASAGCGGTCGPAPTCVPDCGADATCVRTTCVPRPTLGQPCNVFSGIACVSGLVCADGTCVAAPGVGERCLVVSSLGVPGSICGEGLGCEGTTCVVPRIVPLGAACDMVVTRCPAESDCIANVCEVRPPSGMPCRASDRACATGLACNARGVCAPMIGPGCDCTDGSACPWTFRCVAGTCQRIGHAHVDCTAPIDCDWGDCTDGVCTVRALGTPCSTDGRPCSEGHCRPMFNGVCAPTVPSGASCSGDPYGCGSGEMCIDFTTFCALPTEQQNPCAPGWP